MKENIKISVIIPVYNRYEFLKEAVDSVLSQDYNTELIVVDDGSTDETKKISTVPGIKYLRIDHSGMPGAVRNLGVRAADGRYIAFLDSDDLWKPGKIRKQLELFSRNPELRISHTREIWLKNNKIISQSKQRHKREGDIFNDALHKCIIGPSTVMMEKKLYEETGGFREDLEIAEDYEFWLRITRDNPIGYLNEALTIKRGGHNDQLSAKYGHIEFFRIQGLMNLVEKKFFGSEKNRIAAKILSEKTRIYALGCKKRGKNEEASKYEELSRKYRLLSLKN